MYFIIQHPVMLIQIPCVLHQVNISVVFLSCLSINESVYVDILMNKSDATYCNHVTIQHVYLWIDVMFQLLGATASGVSGRHVQGHVVVECS